MAASIWSRGVIHCWARRGVGEAHADADARAGGSGGEDRRAGVVVVVVQRERCESIREV